MNALDSICQNGQLPAVLVGHQAIFSGQSKITYSPVDGCTEIHWQQTNLNQSDTVIEQLEAAFQAWRQWPAPKRGDVVREFGNLVRTHKQALAQLITLEAGKTIQESLGEVQEVIDICDFAVGLSRQLHGLTIASERPKHRMMEQWHPLGPILIISAFNFPMAVWAWNATLALVCGNTLLWKPSEQTPRCAMALQVLLNEAQSAINNTPLAAPLAISAIMLGGEEIGQHLTEDRRLKLVSATGSIPMGKKVAKTVAARLGKSLLELGGNNAMIITPNANLSLALRAAVFSAVGTTGQRCTSLRRLIVHSSLQETVVHNLIKSYQSLAIGNPNQSQTLLGPLVNEQAWAAMQCALSQAQQQGGILRFGGQRLTDNVPKGGCYITPAIVVMPAQTDIVKQETFAPILYVLEYHNLDEAIALQNDVTQGLSSALFSDNLQEVETFLSATGSDCGIANVNIGTSGAEIGGAFGGEKDTGGGRESGSDAWKNYMRRATNTINYGSELPLAQGIQFDL